MHVPECKRKQDKHGKEHMQTSASIQIPGKSAAKFFLPCKIVHSVLIAFLLHQDTFSRYTVREFCQLMHVKNLVAHHLLIIMVAFSKQLLILCE